MEHLNGKIAQEVLDKAGITVNKNGIPFDTLPIFKPGGIRLGTPAVTTRGMKEEEMLDIADLLNEALIRREEPGPPPKPSTTESARLPGGSRCRRNCPVTESIGPRPQWELMSTNLDRFKGDLKNLLTDGDWLGLAMRNECFPEKFVENITKDLGKEAADFIKNLPVFKAKYQRWYSEALTLVRQLLPRSRRRLYSAL